MSNRKRVEDEPGNTQIFKKGCSEIKLFGVPITVPSDGGGGGSASMRKCKSMDNLEACASASAAEEPSGYLSDGFVHQYSKSHQRKPGKPWSEEEHRSFLEGLEKLGKGDWKGIASKFVPSRKSSQVASHAQKYFNRLNLTASNKKRRRGSVFDIHPTHTNAASSSAAASKNIGEHKLQPSASGLTKWYPAAQAVIPNSPSLAACGVFTTPECFFWAQ
ncbi:probable transcription factor At5g61620 isoform X2 [Salvia miltiorrhiza]|uniref:probable transcription factor At5g61620 isoform X2 n=1 Tax=Salvia miltiorrhiza TaxID=226208 RepID=UPI0025AB6329|nr:probable transcription factor At5g61620 isoform X2 [Salvia miltiorrhiza]